MAGEYDDAWFTPGWTSQWGYLPDAGQGGPIPPTPPDGFTFLPITGTFLSPNGKPLWGRLKFTPSIKSARNGATLVVLDSFYVDLHNGQLPANFAVLAPEADSDVEPAIWVWGVSGRVDSATVSWQIQVPSPDPSVSLVESATTVDGSSFVPSVIDGGTP